MRRLVSTGLTEDPGVVLPVNPSTLRVCRSLQNSDPSERRQEGVSDRSCKSASRSFKPEHLRTFPSGFSAFLGKIDPVVLPVARNPGEQCALCWDAFMRA
jgi:hypothetical protein